jgi:hypothetical protein
MVKGRHCASWSKKAVAHFSSSRTTCGALEIRINMAMMTRLKLQLSQNRHILNWNCLLPHLSSIGIEEHKTKQRIHVICRAVQIQTIRTHVQEQTNRSQLQVQTKRVVHCTHNQESYMFQRVIQDSRVSWVPRNVASNYITDLP